MTVPQQSSELLVDELTALEDLRALAPEWERLAATLSPRLPFQTAWWNLRWFESFAESRALVRDTLAVRTVRRSNGELLAVAPLLLTERPSRGPLRARTLQFFGADPNVTELRSVVCLLEHEPAVFGALLVSLRQRSDTWDLLRWSGLRAGGPGEALVLAEPGCEHGLDSPDYLLDLPGSWDTFRAGLSRNIKESLRKCSNAPKREGLEFTRHVITAPDQVDEALNIFFALHAARAAATGTVVHHDAFVSLPARQFLRAVAAGQSAGGAIRVYQIRHGEKIIASRIAFLLGDALYLYYSGYDLAYSRYSVMTTCVAYALEHAIESGMKTVNLSFGDDLSKKRWGPREVLFREALLVSPTRRGRLVRRALTSVESAHAHAKEKPTMVGRLLALGTRRHG